ncbi:hypothetical protein [Terribacillus saccharophilus]|uniref:Uncharacterized protein n=1 Tax=Terribacillus saccharophilus TaxID=361277 RepID=A0A268A7Q2_9BACI|nr:hypothetical protein [Terribacillus saccharophilus]PAD20109.1 hypothetical protein CHH64_15305 [Terribacillus saccharophilus]PAF18536.1 hypothetical protein CHH51_07405 [Terribacillus saccharophilus]PAF20359.1 hypothetical protein CHH49_16390 [Terribacillus saccharophilus]PAF34966.1 hypothetical protein CHH69_13160 [Terribacillus saccharophilus]PAF35632.1 hypothetical protein CHH58_15540 [Terribacillus saccharophilus]
MTITISQAEAYQIERIAHSGLGREQTARLIEAGEWSAIQDSYPKADPEMLQSQKNKLTSALKEGYSISFPTFNGVRNLLHLRFGLEEGKDYAVDEKTVQGLKSDEATAAILRTMFEPLWKVEANSGQLSIIHISKL